MNARQLTPFLTYRSKETSVCTLTIFLYVAENQNGVYQHKVHKLFPITKPAAGRHIQMLVDMALVKKEPAPDDPRMNKLFLTLSGESLYAEMMA